MTTENNNQENQKTTAQKILIFVLYTLLILMVLFSFNAKKNLGQSGYDRCLQEKCETKGEAFCQKFRELNNCCLGAGGQTAQTKEGLICIFD